MSDRFNGESVFGAVPVGDGSAHSCGIAFMAKASAPGRAKTRLVPPLTFDEAAALNTAFLQDVAENLVLAGQQTGPTGAAAIVGEQDVCPETGLESANRAARSRLLAHRPNCGLPVARQ